MKKLVLISLLIIYLSLSAVACVDNKYYLGEQYSKEINKIIDEEIPKAKLEIDKAFFDFQNERNPYDKELIIEWGVSGPVFNLYDKLVKKTNEYVNLHLEKLVGDWEGDLIILVTPYLKNNNVNMQKIDSFNKYSEKKRVELQNKENEIVFPVR